MWQIDVADLANMMPVCPVVLLVRMTLKSAAFSNIHWGIWHLWFLIQYTVSIILICYLFIMTTEIYYATLCLKLPLKRWRLRSTNKGNHKNLSLTRTRVTASLGCSHSIVVSIFRRWIKGVGGGGVVVSRSQGSRCSLKHMEMHSFGAAWFLNSLRSRTSLDIDLASKFLGCQCGASWTKKSDL